MEVVMDDLEERCEALKNDVNQLKEQIGQILEILQNPNRNTPNQPQNQTQHPLYGLPPGYTPLVNNDIDPHTTTSNLQDQTQARDLSCRTNNAQTFTPSLTHDAPNHQYIDPTPTVVLRPHQALEGIEYSDFNAIDLCLFPNIVIPPSV
ncbi:hypothetical protein CR513_39514, partial [Mucuna pruriens]